MSISHATVLLLAWFWLWHNGVSLVPSFVIIGPRVLLQRSGRFHNLNKLNLFSKIFLHG
jgi:hypothetical protein